MSELDEEGWAAAKRAWYAGENIRVVLSAYLEATTPKDASTQPVVVGYVSEAGLHALKDRGLVSIYRSKTKVCNVAVSVRAPVPENAPLDDFELAQCISKAVTMVASAKGFAVSSQAFRDAVQAALATQATATQETT